MSINRILKDKESLYIGTLEGKGFKYNQDSIELLLDEQGNQTRFLTKLDSQIIIGNDLYIYILTIMEN